MASITCLDLVRRDADLDLDLGQEIDHVFGATIQFRVAFLATETLDLGHGDALHTDFGQRLAHVIEFEGFDNGCNKFHFYPPVS